VPQPAGTRIITTSDGRAIPLGNVREVKVVKRGRGALEGAMIGLGVGVVSGLALGLVAENNPNRQDCGYPCTGAEKGELTAAVFGGIGTGLGAIVGAAIGHRDVLTF
jgi:MFS family permease